MTILHHDHDDQHAAEIPGPLEPGRPYATEADAKARQHFDALTREEVIDAIVFMAAQGMSEHTIARATRLSVEVVRQLLAERRR